MGALSHMLPKPLQIGTYFKPANMNHCYRNGQFSIESSEGGVYAVACKGATPAPPFFVVLLEDQAVRDKTFPFQFDTFDEAWQYALMVAATGATP